VEGEAVDLDHQPLLAPEQVHLDALHGDVVLRRRKTGAAHQGDQAALRLGARERRPLLACQQPPQRPGPGPPTRQLQLQLAPGDEAAAQGILDSALQKQGRGARCEVNECPGRLGDGDAVPPDHIGGINRGTVKADSAAIPAVGARYVHVTFGARPERPQVSRGRVARHRARSAGKNSRHLAVELERSGVPDAVHAAVDAVEISAIDPSLKRPGAHAGSEGLGPRNVSLLAPREKRQGRVTFQPHLQDLPNDHIAPQLERL
jgi:hypothetical protein